jgi:hypothetical protein
MTDPAIDYPGQRLDAHLTASVEELKAKDVAPTVLPDV